MPKYIRFKSTHTSKSVIQCERFSRLTRALLLSLAMFTFIQHLHAADKLKRSYFNNGSFFSAVFKRLRRSICFILSVDRLSYIDTPSTFAYILIYVLRIKSCSLACDTKSFWICCQFKFTVSDSINHIPCKQIQRALVSLTCLKVFFFFYFWLIRSTQLLSMSYLIYIIGVHIILGKSISLATLLTGFNLFECY